MGTEEFRTVHTIPGRIRVKVGALKGNADLARELEERLAAEPGVRRAEANPMTGSLLVLYDSEAPAWRDYARALGDRLRAVAPGVEPTEIARRLAEVPPPTNGTVRGTTGIEAHDIMGYFRGLNEQVRSATGGPGLTLLVPFTLLLLGARGLLVAEKVATPRWYDFVWFGFATFLMLNAAGVPTARAAEEAAEVAAGM